MINLGNGKYRSLEEIESALEQQKLIKEINWDQVTVIHYSKKNQIILDNLAKLQSLLEKSKIDVL